MAISMNWINDYINIKDTDLKDLANKITKAGINIETVTSKNIDNLIIGHVIKCEKHPDSDHLNVCEVDTGSEIKQIVCGAPNVKSGLKVIVALPGAMLPGDFKIKETKIRGIESSGMICALYELGLEEKTEENYNRGIEELASDAPVGENPIEYLGLNDTIYELDLNPNRTDCNNHISFAYEVAAVLKKEVILPLVSYSEDDESIKDNFNLEIKTNNCTMYNAKMVKDLKIGPSPDFIKRRLENAGMRSINNVVDISNYVMLEYGQPLHFFDYDKLGNKIVVRMAENEKITTLDGIERTLRSEDIVITDGKKPVCIAGVMGGINTGVDEKTTTILIESAIFTPYNVRKTSIDFDLRSEASLRYEKGLNYEYCNLAIERACHLLQKYAQGKVLKDTISYDTIDKKNRQLKVTLEEVNSILGMTLKSSDIESSLSSLGFKFDKDIYTVYIPNRRLDVEEHVQDIAEEVGRIYGYDNIVSKLPSLPTKSGSYIGNVKTRKLISKRLRSLGLNETKTYTLIDENDDRLFNYQKGDSIKLLKPLSADKSIVRQSILPSLLKVIDYNNTHGIKDIMIYEISNTYKDEQTETTKLAIALKGDYLVNQWQEIKIKTDFYLIKGIIQNLFDYLGLKNRYTFAVNKIFDLHPGISAEILLDHEPVGFIGKVHPNVRKDDIYVAETNLNMIMEKNIKPIKYKEVSKYPSITKDVAFVVKEETKSEEIEKIIQKSGGKLLTNINVFDLYKGENVKEGEKSIAYSLIFNDMERTLTEDEINNLFNKIITDVENKCDAKLRN